MKRATYTDTTEIRVTKDAATFVGKASEITVSLGALRRIVRDIEAQAKQPN